MPTRVVNWFKSLHKKLKDTRKSLRRIWFPKKDKGLKKAAKQIVNEVAKLQVKAMQSSHCVKNILVILQIIGIVTTMVSVIFIQSQGAAMDERMRIMNETLSNATEKLNDPTFGDMVGTVVDSAIGICHLVAGMWNKN